MAHPLHHAESSVRKWGGKVEDYLPMHAWFDETKAHFADARHRAMRHHSEGIFLLEKIFGTSVTITLENGNTREIPVRWIGEQHVTEDLGWIPSMSDWLKEMSLKPWMTKAQTLSRYV